MSRRDNLFELPKNLPVPVDDGVCDHLTGMRMPSVPLRSTAGRVVDLAGLPGTTVVYCYPRTGQPNKDPPASWNEIPGARGCTPQSCAFREHYQELQALSAQLFGLSTQDTAYQREAAERLKLPFELLSDEGMALVNALRLPTFEFESMTLVKRLTLIIRDGQVAKVFYPVFPTDKNAGDVIEWLSQETTLSSLERIAKGTGDRAARARRVAEVIRDARKYRWVGIYDIGTTEIVAIAWTGNQSPFFPRFPVAQGLNGAAVLSRAPVNVPDVTKDPRYLTAFGSTRSEIIVPVKAHTGGLVLGTIDVESERVNAFGGEEQSFLEACAGAMGALWRTQG